MTSVFLYSVGFVLMLGGSPNPGARSAPLLDPGAPSAPLPMLVGLHGARPCGSAAVLPCLVEAHCVRPHRVPGAAAVAMNDAQAAVDAVQQIARLIEAQDLPAAKAAVDSALRAEPTNPVLQNYAGVIEAQRGAFEVAESHFQAAIRLAPRATAPYENLGRLYQERSAADASTRKKALQTYQRLLTIDPSNIEGLYQTGFLLALEGQFGESHAFIARLPEEVRERPHVLAVMAVDLAGVKDTTAAMAVVERLAAHPDLAAADVVSIAPTLDRVQDDRVASALLEALDRRHLASADLLHRLGQLYARLGKFADSRAALERAAAAGGATLPILMDLARAAVKLGDHKGALGYLAHARELDPNNANVHFLFGMVCVELNLGAEAYESLKKAVAIAPENALINYAMGAVSMHRHEPSESLPYFEKYVRLVPDDPRGRFALGAAQFYSNQFDQARVSLQEAATHPETAAGAHYFLARIARQSNDLETARREIEASLRANGKAPDAWAELGLLQTRAAQYAEAEQSLGKALALDPDNYLATVNLTTLYTRTRDPRRDAQAARLAALQDKRAEQAQEFLRIIEVVP
jgi:tetratricopeptide (TPR) repeat protein